MFLDKQVSPNGHARRAHLQMTRECQPRQRFVADFEGSLLKVLNGWEWDVTGDGPRSIDGPELRMEYPHAGERCLFASTPGRSVRVWFTPYVDAPIGRFSGYLLIEPEVRDAKLSLVVGIETGDILEPIRTRTVELDDIPARKWFEFDVDIEKAFPKRDNSVIVTCFIEVRADQPGLEVSIDDVEVTSENAPAMQSEKEDRS
jgi:hypothetical protein